MISLYVAKLKMFSPESEIFPWVWPEMFFVMSLRLSDHKLLHNIIQFFFSISLGFSLFLRSYFVVLTGPSCWVKCKWSTEPPTKITSFWFENFALQLF